MSWKPPQYPDPPTLSCHIESHVNIWYLTRINHNPIYSLLLYKLQNIYLWANYQLIIDWLKLMIKRWIRVSLFTLYILKINLSIHIKTFVWMRLSNIPDMLNPYCYKIFALFHLQSPIMLWLRYCLKCPHNCRAKKDNCLEFYIITQTKIVKPNWLLG